MMKERIVTDKAPGAIGPYSQGMKIGDLTNPYQSNYR